MAKKKKKSGSKKKGRFKGVIFQRFGKYFLLVLLFLMQAIIAYGIVDSNYERIYSYTNSFFPTETGKYDFEQIIVNPAGTNGKRYLLVEISLELVDIEDIEVIESNNSKIRNNMIEYLSERSVSELQTLRGKEELRTELIKIINQTIERRSVRNLYYSKYVMQ